MNRYQLRRKMTDWIAGHGYTQAATLAFNDHGIEKEFALDQLRKLHAKLDRIALGHRWARKSPSQRTNSIAFIENPLTNLHFHMLWRAPRFEEKLVEALPVIWQQLVPKGNVHMRPIVADDHIFWYCTKQLRDDSYILSAEFSSI